MIDSTDKGLTKLPEIDASQLRAGVVVSRFNASITNNLRSGALEELERHHVSRANIHVYSVSGAYEIPLVLQEMAISERFNLLLAIGCVIRGETPHFDYVCTECVSGVTRIMLDHSIPIGLGVLTCENMQQAIARSSIDSASSHSNKGAEAAQAALETWSTLARVRTRS